MGVFDALGGAMRGAIQGVRDVMTPKPESVDTINGQAFNFREEAVSFVRKKFERAQEDRRPMEMQWLLTLNFLQGNQYCDVNIFSSGIKQIRKRYKYESREVFNKLAPIYEARIAKLTNVQPSPYVRPATSEPSDIAAAKVSAAVARDIDNYNEMLSLRKQAIAWSEICGVSFIKSVWDPEAGDVIGEDEGGTVRNGYVKKILVNAFEAYPIDQKTPGIKNHREFIHAKAYPTEYVAEHWGKELTGRNVDAFSLSITGIGYGGLGMNASNPTVVKTELKDHVVVMEYTCLPCKKFPKGIVIIVGENELLDMQEMTYYVGERNEPSLNLEEYACVTNPASVWPMCVLHRLIPVQRAYNAVRNKKHEALNRKAIGIVSMEDDGNADIEALEEEGIYPGKIFTYRVGGKAPQFMHDNVSTQDFDNEETKLEGMFESISGVSPFMSRSAVPTGMEAASALEKVREQDTERIGLTIENINHGAVRGFKIGLRLCKQYAQGPRIMRMVGKNDDVAVEYWMASDLTSDDVIIDKESSLIQSSAERRQRIVQMMQYGILEKDVDPRIRMQIIRAMDVGDWENADAEEKMHVARALRENMRLKTGEMPEAKDYDNHVLHLAEHNKMRIDTEWDEMVAQNPMMEAMMNQHVADHKAIVQQAQMEAQMAMMAAQAGPPQQIA